MAGNNDRRRRFDDMFDDLDRFFAPEETEAGRSGEVAQGAGQARGRRAPGASHPDEEVVRLPDAETPGEPRSAGGTPGGTDEQDLDTDLLPGDWMPDVSDLDLPEEPIEAETAEPGEQPAPEETSAPPARADRPDETDDPDRDAEWRPVETGTTQRTQARGGEEPDGEPGEEGEAAPTDRPEADEAEQPATAQGLPPSTSAVDQRPDVDEPSSAAWAPQPTAPEPGEMSRDDWSRLREVLGEEEEEEASFLVEQPVEPAPGESMFDLEGLREAGAAAGPPEGPDDDEWEDESAGVQPHGEAPPELTLEDLRKPPPEYRDLPRAEPEEEGPMVVGEVPPSESRDQGPAEEPEETSRPFWEEVDIADVEQTADEVAGEFASAETPDLEVDLLADPDRSSRPRTVRVGEPETMTGPSWEEPGSRPLIPEPGPPPGGRNLPLALLTGIVLAVAGLIFLVWPPVFAVFASGVALVGQAELYEAMRRRGLQPATALGLVVGGLTLAGAYLKGEPAMLFFLALGVVASFVWYMTSPQKAREGALGNVGATVFGIAYVPFLGGFVLVILSMVNSGRALMLTVLGLTILYDVVAFVVGSVYGSTPLAPTISPRKSRQGLIGASIVTLLVALAVVPAVIDVLDFPRAAALAVIVLVFAPLGDLAESMIKRDLGIKDSGAFLPGHGGALDRIDSVVFVAPAAFYLFRLIF